MLERIVGFSLSRFAAASVLLLSALAGCNQTETGVHGHVEIIPSGLRDAACFEPVPGELRFDGMHVADALTVSADELCHNWIVRKELPAGLYTVSWQAEGEDSIVTVAGSNGADGDARWEVRSAGIVNVFPERTTRVRVLRDEPENELPTQALLVTGG